MSEPQVAQWVPASEGGAWGDKVGLLPQAEVPRPVAEARRVLRLQIIMDRTRYPTRRRHLRDPENYSDLDALTPAARLAMVWPLTLQAWAFHTGLTNEPRLRRDVGRVAGRGG